MKEGTPGQRGGCPHGTRPGPRQREPCAQQARRRNINQTDSQIVCLIAASGTVYLSHRPTCAPPNTLFGLLGVCYLVQTFLCRAGQWGRGRGCQRRESCPYRLAASWGSADSGQQEPLGGHLCRELGFNSPLMFSNCFLIHERVTTSSQPLPN